MFTCQLNRITRNARGDITREAQQITADEMIIGRGEECQIHLSDPRANTHFATLKRNPEGALCIDGEGTLLSINDAFEHHATLVPGASIQLGPYALVVEAVGGEYDLTLSLELVHPLPSGSGAVERAPARSLAEAGYSVRKWAWGLAVLVFLILLVVPLTVSLSKGASGFLAKSGVYPGRLWSPGEISSEHNRFSLSCNNCHERPLAGVRNEACQQCHQTPRQHLADALVEKHVLGGVRCVQCHREHHGSLEAAGTVSGACIDCHGEIKARHAKAKSPAIHDFGTDHPAFRLSIWTGPGAADVRRVLQDVRNPAKDENALKFPHDQHVGLVEVPVDRGTIKDMKCTDCHAPDAAGNGFLPISMDQHCDSCHLDQREVKGRKLPHGSVAALSDTLRDFYEAQAFRENKPKAWVAEQLDKAVKSMSKGSGCSYCHTVGPANEASLLTVTPPHLTNRWFPAARFPHARHATQKCTDCHEKIETSSDSADLDIPDIANCRQCHGGDRPTGNRLATRCDDCHQYHAGIRAK